MQEEIAIDLSPLTPVLGDSLNETSPSPEDLRLADLEALILQNIPSTEFREPALF